MSRQRRPDVGPKWIVATEKKQELLIISEITYWVSHVTHNPFRSFRCGGRACIPCSQGQRKIVRGVVLAVDTTGRERWYEVRERQEREFESYGSAIGLRVSIRKTGPHTNSPVDLKVLGEEPAYGRDISRFVDSLGGPAICLGPLEAGEALATTEAEAEEPYDGPRVAPGESVKRKRPSFMEED